MMDENSDPFHPKRGRSRGLRQPERHIKAKRPLLVRSTYESLLLHALSYEIKVPPTMLSHEIHRNPFTLRRPRQFLFCLLLVFEEHSLFIDIWTVVKALKEAMPDLDATGAKKCANLRRKYAVMLSWLPLTDYDDVHRLPGLVRFQHSGTGNATVPDAYLTILLKQSQLTAGNLLEHVCTALNALPFHGDGGLLVGAGEPAARDEIELCEYVSDGFGEALCDG
ncbi:unnamed protein product [Protopolystoma xenopodis]|uniref:Uncharacterized protein n=1 Tax=Protopolystoma xenopodis TaxID=117903 RepID=A0A3S5CMY2_9PLAT|nr:unnamed protein product [Protopolystoma xenopodis]